MKREYAVDKLIENHDKCSNMFELCERMGIKNVGGEDYKEIRELAKQIGVELKFTYKRQKYTISKKYDLKDVLVENSQYKSMSTLKKRLFKEKLKEYKCEKCGISEWNGEKIELQLHHINGINNDNRLENLQILCPNCHSQTDNYSGKNSNRENNTTNIHSKKSMSIKEWNDFKEKMWVNNHPSKETLINLFKEYKNFVQIGKLYNVSDNAIRKWFKRYGLPHRRQDLLEYLK